MSHPSDVYLSHLPNFAYLIPAILCKSNKVFDKKQVLPTDRYWVKNIRLATDKINAFNQLTAWSHREIVHPGFLHTLGFPLQLKLMLHKDFPFSIMGVVHIANKIEQYKTVHPTSSLDVCCTLGGIKQLKIGYLFTIETEFFVKQQRVMYARHQYLRRGHNITKSKIRSPHESDWSCAGNDESWPLKTTLGWQYARCSQDYNPIHLHPFSAKLLGFKQHIVHGMWLKSRAFSALNDSSMKKIPSALSCEVEFKKPLLLPNSVVFQQRTIPSETAIEFRITSNDNQQTIEHMTGKLEFLEN
ncbi:MaoC/PaaZ C-terminal domain-containing protein [Paraglaciecola sp.]|uniref:MaoC family dehydratase n=1 Tax=Paraglaciecola sp. TaxID=1920173 RepID=UPI0030F4A104